MRFLESARQRVVDFILEDGEDPGAPAPEAPAVAAAPPAAPAEPAAPADKSLRRQRRFETVLSATSVDKKALAELSWSGVPAGVSRGEVWQMLLGYRPLTRERAAQALQRKRGEYLELRRDLYDSSRAVSADLEDRSDQDAETALLRQIRKDLPRTRLRAGALSASEFLVEHAAVQRLMERVLFVWAVRQPASGYVQGLNDVLLPLLLVFVVDRAEKPFEELDADAFSALCNASEGALMDEIEADCYWCLSKILSEIFDHYTHGQPGMQRMVLRLKEILSRIDEPLSRHLEDQGIDLLHTACRWITCLMVRELPVPCCIRLWDACVAESASVGGAQVRGAAPSAGFEALLVYFCACFTAYFSASLRAMDFEAITLFMQKMPTDDFTEKDVEVLLSEAYVLKSLFGQAPSHLPGSYSS